MDKKQLFEYIKYLLKQGYSEQYVESKAWGKRSMYISMDDISKMIERAKKEVK